MNQRSNRSRKTPASYSKGRRPQQNNARWMAFRALQAFRTREVFVSRVLDDQFKQSSIPSRDRKMATELANEAVRRQDTLDIILQKFVTRERENVEDDLWTILQLGCLQIVCLPHVSSHAAVNETVELCHLIQNSRAKGFVNGVLRNIQRSVKISEHRTPFELSNLSGRQLPLSSGKSTSDSRQLVEFDRNVFTDPSSDPLLYISEVTSLPQWLLQRLQPDGANYNEMLQTGLWFTTSGRMSLRVNLLQTDREKTLSVLEAAEVPARPGRLAEAIELDGSVAIIDLPGYQEGWFSVQDLSSMEATDLLDPQPGETVLDMCAAPGGKTTHMAERMQNQGRIVACDTAKNRIRIINENTGRLQLSIVETRLIQDDGSDLPDDTFDAVLIDVPCSNTGVLGKRPEARWRLTPMSFRELIPLQLRLLRQGLQRVKPGGRLVYSTCSIDPEENQGVVTAVLDKYPEFQLQKEQFHRPGNPCDGGYQALLVRK